MTSGSREMSLLRSSWRQDDRSTISVPSEYFQGEKKRDRSGGSGAQAFISPSSGKICWKQVFQEKKFPKSVGGEGELITGIAPIFSPSQGGEVVGIVVASHFIPKSLTSRCMRSHRRLWNISIEDFKKSRSSLAT